MSTCVHTGKPCDLARGCEWNAPLPSRKAEACEWFRASRHSANETSCLACQMPASHSCRFVCFRLAHRSAIQQIQEREGNVEHEAARRIFANCASMCVGIAFSIVNLWTW